MVSFDWFVLNEFGIKSHMIQIVPVADYTAVFWQILHNLQTHQITSVPTRCTLERTDLYRDRSLRPLPSTYIKYQKISDPKGGPGHRTI